MSDSTNTAFLRLVLPPYSVAFRLCSHGSPLVVKIALRRACSHARSSVYLRPGVFIAALAHQLVKCSGTDITSLAAPDDAGDNVAFHYHVSIDGKRTPVIEYFEHDFSAPIRYPLFRWIGLQYIRQRPSKEFTQATHGKRRGRRAGASAAYREMMREANTPILQTNKPNTNTNTSDQTNSIITFDQKHPYIPGTDDRVRQMAPRILRVNFGDLELPNEE